MPKKHRKKIPQMFAELKKVRTFATANEKQTQAKLKSLNVFQCEKRRLAQLVQSICLTSRGSAVRIRQRPPPLTAP